MNPHAVNATPYGNVTEDVNQMTGPISIGGKQVVGAGPLTNLNIGMDYWSGGSPAVLGASRGKRGSATNNNALIPSPSVMPGELWLQVYVRGTHLYPWFLSPCLNLRAELEYKVKY